MKFHERSDRTERRLAEFVGILLNEFFELQILFPKHDQLVVAMSFDASGLVHLGFNVVLSLSERVVSLVSLVPTRCFDLLLQLVDVVLVDLNLSVYGISLLFQLRYLDFAFDLTIVLR